MSLEIKSYLQKCPRKKVLVENAWEQRMFTTLQKKGQLVLKIPLDIFNMQMLREKVLFIKASQT